MSSRFKLHVYISLVVLIVLLAAPMFSSARAASVSGVTMKVEPHYSGHFKFGEWLPLRVTLANDGPPIRAELRADTTESGGQTTFVAPVELPTGARKRVTLYVMPPSFAKAVRVRLMDGSRELDSQSVTVRLERNVNYIVGLIVPRTEPFAVMNGLTLNSDVNTQQFKGRSPSYPRPVTIVALSLLDVPDRPEGLRALDAIIISGVDTSSLTPEQGQALQGWVEQGGRLILGGGAGAARTLSGLPDALAGEWRLSSAGATEISSLEALTQFAGQTVRVPGPFVVTWASGGRGLIVQDKQVLLAERSVGAGVASYSALDLAGSPFDAWAGTSRFWEKLLMPGSNFTGPVDVSPRIMRANSIASALQNLPALELPSIRWLAALLIVYTLIVGPVNYVVLRRLRKLEWGWITIGALTALFSIGAFALGHTMRGGEVIVNKLSVLELNTSVPSAPMQSYVGIFSPSRRAYTLSFPGRALVMPLYPEGSPWRSPTSDLGAAELVQGDPAQARGIQVNQWAMQGFQTESSAPAGWRIESALTFEGDRVRGTLTNYTGETIQGAALVYGNRFVQLDDLASGAQENLDHLLQQGQSSFPYFLIEKQVGPQGPSREYQLRQQLLSSYFQTYGGPTQAPTRPTLIGWMRASPLDVRVEGTRWATQQTSLIIATLSTRYEPGHIRLPFGVLSAQLANGSGNVGLCGEGNQVYVDRNSTAILEFHLPEELSAMQIARMAWRIQGGPAPIVEVYTRNAEWIKQTGPELTDPARFVLAEGSVRLRVSNTTNSSGCLQYDLEVEGELK